MTSNFQFSRLQFLFGVIPCLTLPSMVKLLNVTILASLTRKRSNVSPINNFFVNTFISSIRNANHNFPPSLHSVAVSALSYPFYRTLGVHATDFLITVWRLIKRGGDAAAGQRTGWWDRVMSLSSGERHSWLEKEIPWFCLRRAVPEDVGIM